MKKTQRDYFLRTLKEAQEQFDESVTVLADKIRKEVIIPACKQHNLEFFSGNGVFFFTTNRGTQVSDGMMLTREDDSKRLQRALKPIFEILNEEVTRDNYIGYYISDVRKENYT